MCWRAHWFYITPSLFTLTMVKTQNTANIPQSTLDHFQAIPWCSTHLSDPAFHVVSMSRTLDPGRGHSLMAETWNTPDTITDLVSIYRPPDTTAGQRGELRRFYTFGTGLNAHPGLLHGGVIATVLDSTMGNICGMQMPGLKALFTVELNIKYRKPVPTPGTVMARSWIAKMEGRKIWVQAAVESETGEIHATAEGVWLAPKAKI